MTALGSGYAVTTVVSVVLLVVAWRCPRIGRVLFAALFLGASVFNAVTALRTPNVYVDGLAPRAFTPMREFIERVVALFPDAFVLAIAAGQFAAGVGLVVGRGLWFQLCVAGAACFLVGISWLGVGAAVPLTLVLAAGVLLLLRARDEAGDRTGRSRPAAS